MSSRSNIEKRREHGRWHKDDDLRRDELAMCERQINEAIRNLPQLELALRSYAKYLEQQGSSIRLYEQDFAVREETLAESERGEIPEELVVQSQEHEREAEQHLAWPKAHQTITTQQRALATELPAKPASRLSDH